MRRPIRIALLALGTVLGYGFAFHAMRHHHHGYGRYGYEEHGCFWHDGEPKPAETPAPKAQ